MVRLFALAAFFVSVAFEIFLINIAFYPPDTMPNAWALEIMIALLAWAIAVLMVLLLSLIINGEDLMRVHEYRPKRPPDDRVLPGEPPRGGSSAVAAVEEDR